MGNGQVAARIKRHFIPLAAPTPDVRKFKKKHGWEIDVSYTYGIYIITADGKRLAQATGRGVVGVDARVNTAKQLATFLDLVLAKAPKASPRQVEKKSLVRFVGLQSDGSARMPVCVRERGKFGLPMLDSVRLSPEQLRSLAPPSKTLGERYAIPATIARQFSAMLTYDSCSSCKIYAKDVTLTKMNAEVSGVSVEEIEVRVGGLLSGIGKQMPTSANGEFSGRMIFDKRNQLQQLLLVYEGRYHGGLLGKYHADGMPVQSLVAWQMLPRASH